MNLFGERRTLRLRHARRQKYAAPDRDNRRGCRCYSVRASRQADPRGKMREVLADGQGRGGENPGAGPRLDVFAQAFRDFEGRVVQQQSIGVGVDPAQPCLVRQLAQGGQGIGQMRGAAPRTVRRCRRPLPKPSSCAAMSLRAVSISGSASRNVSGRFAHSWRPGPRGNAARRSSSRDSSGRRRQQ